MDQFIQYTPTEVVFGKETENQAGAEVKKWGGTMCPEDRARPKCRRLRRRKCKTERSS